MVGQPAAVPGQACWGGVEFLGQQLEGACHSRAVGPVEGDGDLAGGVVDLAAEVEQVDYTTSQITVTLDRPDSPRVARALELLAEELNATPTCLPGDRRRLTYQVTAA